MYFLSPCYMHLIALTVQRGRQTIKPERTWIRQISTSGLTSQNLYLALLQTYEI